MNFLSWPHIAAPPAVGWVWTILAGKRSSAPRRVQKTFGRAGQGLSNSVNVDWIPVIISELWILKDPQLEAWNERHLPSPAFEGPWRADASSDRNGLKRFSIEDFAGCRMLWMLTRFQSELASYEFSKLWIFKATSTRAPSCVAWIWGRVASKRPFALWKIWKIRLWCLERLPLMNVRWTLFVGCEKMKRRELWTGGKQINININAKQPPVWHGLSCRDDNKWAE